MTHRIPLGTGFGTGTVASAWSQDDWLADQRADERCIVLLIHTLCLCLRLPMDDEAGSSMEKGASAPSVYATLNRSSLLPLMSEFLQTESVMDLDKSSELYGALLDVICAITEQPSLHPLLFARDGMSQHRSVADLIASVRKIAAGYLSRVAMLSPTRGAERSMRPKPQHPHQIPPPPPSSSDTAESADDGEVVGMPKAYMQNTNESALLDDMQITQCLKVANGAGAGEGEGGAGSAVSGGAVSTVESIVPYDNGPESSLGLFGNHLASVPAAAAAAAANGLLEGAETDLDESLLPAAHPTKTPTAVALDAAVACGKTAAETAPTSPEDTLGALLARVQAVSVRIASVAEAARQPTGTTLSDPTGGGGGGGAAAGGDGVGDEEMYLRLLGKYQFAAGKVLDQTDVSSHIYAEHAAETRTSSGKRTERLAQELGSLSSSLPLSVSSTVLLRCDKRRLDYLKVLIMGPDNTYGK